MGQSLRKDGGVNYFSGTNDKGILFAGNKKLDPIAGKEEIHSTPIRTVTGEDISVKKGINIVKATEGDFSSSINITGGDNNKSISEFKGPVVFSNKITSLLLKVLRHHLYSYREMQQFLENLQLESQLQHPQELLVILYSVIIHRVVNILVGFIQLTMHGRDLVALAPKQTSIIIPLTNYTSEQV